MVYREEEKSMWLEDWKQSGQSAWGYAKTNGLNYRTFKNWTKAETKQSFVEIPSNPVCEQQVMKPAMPIAEILIEKGDVKIHIPLAMGYDELRAVMEGLGASL